MEFNPHLSLSESDRLTQSSSTSQKLNSAFHADYTNLRDLHARSNRPQPIRKNSVDQCLTGSCLGRLLIGLLSGLVLAAILLVIFLVILV